MFEDNDPVSRGISVTCGIYCHPIITLAILAKMCPGHKFFTLGTSRCKHRTQAEELADEWDMLSPLVSDNLGHCMPLTRINWDIAEVSHQENQDLLFTEPTVCTYVWRCVRLTYDWVMLAHSQNHSSFIRFLF